MSTLLGLPCCSCSLIFIDFLHLSTHGSARVLNCCSLFPFPSLMMLGWGDHWKDLHNMPLSSSLIARLCLLFEIRAHDIAACILLVKVSVSKENHVLIWITTNEMKIRCFVYTSTSYISIARWNLVCDNVTLIRGGTPDYFAPELIATWSLTSSWCCHQSLPRLPLKFRLHCLFKKRTEKNAKTLLFARIIGLWKSSV